MPQTTRAACFWPPNSGQPISACRSKGKLAKEDVLKLPVSECDGHALCRDALYVGRLSAKNKHGRGGSAVACASPMATAHSAPSSFPRMERRSGEHGAPASARPDKKQTLIVCWQFFAQPAERSPNSPHRNCRRSDSSPRPRKTANGLAPARSAGRLPSRMDHRRQRYRALASGDATPPDVRLTPMANCSVDSDMEWAGAPQW